MPNYNVDANENKNGIEKDSPLYKAIKYVESILEDAGQSDATRYNAARFLIENHGLTYKLLEPYSKPVRNTGDKSD